MGAREIYEALRDQILTGIFGADRRLPSSRALAHELAVSRTTVTVAYQQLLAEGFIEVRQGARPRVASAVVSHGGYKKASKRSGPFRLSVYGERIREIAPSRDHVASNRIADFRHGDLASSDFPAAI